MHTHESSLGTQSAHEPQDRAKRACEHSIELLPGFLFDTDGRASAGGASGTDRPRPGAPLGRGLPAGGPLSRDRAGGAYAGGRSPTASWVPRWQACRQSLRGGQGGLLDLVLDSGFATNRILYFCFSEPGPGWQQHGAGPGEAVGRLVAAGGCHGDLQPEAQGLQQPALRVPNRGGARRVAVPDFGGKVQQEGRRPEAGQPPRQGRAADQGRGSCAWEPVRRPGRCFA